MDQPDATIRPLNLSDQPSFYQLRLRALFEEPEIFMLAAGEFARMTLPDQTRMMRSTPDQFILGAFNAEGTLVGLVDFHRRQRHKIRHLGDISGMYVAPEHRARGIGRALLSAAISRARNLADLEALTLIVSANDQPARRLYLSAGFQSYGLEPLSLKVEDKYVDGEFMMLKLR